MKYVKTFLSVFLLWTLVGVVSKIAFLLMYHSLFAGVSVADQCLVLWYGLRLDVAMAGYLTLVPGLMLVASVWYQGRPLFWLWKGYFAVTAFLAALAYVANLGLYGYWGFPLDNTPLLYVRTSPADALASMTWWQLVLALLAVIVVAVVVCRLFPGLPVGSKRPGTFHRRQPLGRRVAVSVLLLLLDALLLLPIRGGVSTGTNHTGSVYFSNNIRLNHAAVNPIFCFMEAVIHQEEIGTKYRFMDDAQASSRFADLTHTALRTDSLRSGQKLNVVLVVLESFSDTVTRVQGVTPQLLRLSSEGLSFTRFYANSFRTDRALVSIHSGLPAQPTMSVMDMPHKSTTLPSLARTLAANGYQTVFYYGGDVNYSNMRSYFMGTGFSRVVSEADFPARQRTSKWGVADGPVYDRMLADIKADRSGQPFFLSIMTESSHEPFDVPGYQQIAGSPVLNAFSYADHCLGRFVDGLRALPCWEHTLVAIVADHLGAYPENPDNYQLWRYHIPFVITGGAVQAAAQCSVVGSQIDIPATLLGMLGIDHSDFVYSKDLFDDTAPHFAFFTFPDAMGMVTDSSSVIYDNTLAKQYAVAGPDASALVVNAQAYLQKLYDDIDKQQ